MPPTTELLSKLKLDTSDRKTVIAATAVGLSLVAGGAYLVGRSYARRGAIKKFPKDSLPTDAYDAIIVGAGPSGSTAAHYMAKAGAKVALLDKEHFPRDKYCGDAVCTPALRILEDMGVLQELVANNETHFADAGGFVSPSGLAYIGASKKRLGGAAACAVKRIHLDNRIAKCAAKTGAKLMEGFEVGSDVAFDKDTGLWTVKSTKGKVVRGRVLVCADGATSRLATQLGYCTEPPKGVCSRSYIEPGTHNTDFDGVCFYPKESLPGYTALFKHANDELGYCYYLIPCGKEDGQCGDVKESDLYRLHYDAVTKDPFISKALGPNPKLERMKAASLRLGGQGLSTTYDNHLLIIGDAAGHIDPLTGEGIHTAIMGGKAAAETLLEARESGNYGRGALQKYEARWIKLYGHDFALSKAGADLIYRYPILLDACANEMQRVGDSMMSKWAEVMTNMRPKTYFFRPDVAVPLAFAIGREFWNQYIVRRPSGYAAIEGAATGNGSAHSTPVKGTPNGKEQ